MRLPQFIFFLLLPVYLLLPVSAARDVKKRSGVKKKSDVIDGNVTIPAGSEMEALRAEVKKLRRTFFRFKRGGGSKRGKGKLCEEATGQINAAISMELSGLRTQLHTSDTMKSLRSELDYGLTSLRSELDNKMASLRAELETGLMSMRSELQSGVQELKSEVTSELTDVRVELQYNLNAACSGDKELTKAVADLSGSLQGLKSEMESRIATSRSELEQKMMGVRTELDGGLSGVKSQFKTDVVTVRSDLQDMVSDVRMEMQDNVAGTRSDLQTGFTAAQSGLQNTLHGLQADVMNMGSKNAGDLAQLKAELSGVSAVIKAQVQTQLSEAASQLKKTLQTLEDDQQEQLQHLAERLNHLATEHSRLSYNSSSLRQSVAQLRTEAEKRLDNLREDTERRWKNLETRVDDAVNNVLLSDPRNNKNNDNNIPLSGLDLDQRLSSVQSDLDRRLGDLQAGLHTKVGDLDGRVKDVESRQRTSGEAVANVSAALRATDVTLRELQASLEETRLEKARQSEEEEKKEEEVEGFSGGSTYVRWGSSGCPDSAELVYSGVVGGSSYDTDGGAANRLCLTLSPQAGNVSGARTYLYGAEYKFSEHHDLDVVCAVCRTPLPATVMVPGTQTCPEGWARQYAGHLTAGMVGHRAASEYLCLDGSPESRAGSQEIRNGALFYYVFTECGSLPCPPYTNMYVSCVVCSR